MQRFFCTSRQVGWTYRAPSSRSGQLWCARKTLAACKGAGCARRLGSNFCIPGRIFDILKGRETIIGCSPRAQLNVDVSTKTLDVQGFSMRSGLRGDPKYSSWFGTKTRQKSRVLQCFCDTWRILVECNQVAKSVKTLVFYSATWLLRSVVKSCILHPKHGLVLVTRLHVQRTSCTTCRVGDVPCRGSAARPCKSTAGGGNQFA